MGRPREPRGGRNVESTTNTQALPEEVCWATACRVATRENIGRLKRRAARAVTVDAITTGFPALDFGRSREAGFLMRIREEQLRRGAR